MIRSEVKVGMQVRILPAAIELCSKAKCGWVPDMQKTIGEKGVVDHNFGHAFKIRITSGPRLGCFFVYTAGSFESVEVKPKVIYAVGNVFKDTDNGVIYHLVAAGARDVVLVSLNNGNRYKEVVRVESTSNITADEFEDIGDESTVRIAVSVNEYINSLTVKPQRARQRVFYTSISNAVYESKEDFEQTNPSKTFIKFVD